MSPEARRVVIKIAESPVGTVVPMSPEARKELQAAGLLSKKSDKLTARGLATAEALLVTAEHFPHLMDKTNG